MAYLGNNLDSDIQVNKYQYTATAGQTNFACTYDRAVDVYLNGVKLASEGFSASNGVEVVLDVGASEGDIVAINGYFDVTYYNPTVLNDSSGTTVVDASSGNVGLGTDSPSTKLDVAGTVTAYGLTVGSNAEVIFQNSGTGITDTITLRNYNGSGNGNKILSGKALVLSADDPNNSGAGQSYMAFETDGTERMRIDSAGRVTMPYQPAVQVDGALHSGLNYIGNNVRTNVGGHYNTSTGVFTAPVSGTYLVSYFITPSDGNSHSVDIHVNGGRIGTNLRQYGSQYQTATNTKVLALSSGDYTECRRRNATYGIYGAGLSIYLLG